jgi:RNA polymerase II subunit A C-terminal domain phosphatase
MELCSHPTVMRDLCAECGADLSNEKQTASVPMVHSVPELKVSLEVILQNLNLPEIPYI